MNILLRLIRSYLKFSIVRMFIRMKWKLTRNLQRWISIGKALNFIGHMKVILVAIAYTRLSSLFNQIPSSLVRTWWVSNSFKFMISTSGSHNLRRIWRLTAVSLSSSTGASELFIVVKNGFEKMQPNIIIVLLQKITTHVYDVFDLNCDILTCT